ncbi:bifunctional riboflavin kinase/FAD synthetase [Caenispirillum salinarum]|nr:bifunctional riboflavin kinase/FAD synthetase [Caenispirillum salinarum]
MRIFRHYEEVSPDVRGAVIALGNFDGVHRGHRVVLGTALRIARETGAPAAAMTFEPHPRMVFRPDLEPFRLTSFRTKSRHIAALGLDFLYAQHFDTAFASKTAEDFVRDVLVAGLGVSHVVVGADYVFGKGRQGDVAFLRQMAADHGFDVTSVGSVTAEDGTIYSSTNIRGALRDARPRDAARLLGRFWEIEGRVEHGDKRGRTIGFPTANVSIGELLRPAVGVYAVRAGVDAGENTVWMDGVANFGRRPTFDKQTLLLEVHLFDRQIDLYGEHLRVALVDHLRGERKFSGLEELKAQIQRDEAEARRILATLPGHGEAAPEVAWPDAFDAPGPASS